MKQTDCYWYLSESLRPWEAAVAGAVARAAIRDGAVIRSYSGGGTESLGIPGLLSWRSLNAMERLFIVAARGNLWHLWGQPPSWWMFVRARSRTVHSRFDEGSKWEGHPTTLFSAAPRGYTYIPPAFEMKMSWGTEEGKDIFDESRPALFLLTGSADDGRLYAQTAASLSSMLIDFDRAEEGVKLFASGNCVLLLPRPTDSLALLAAFASLRGIPTVAARSAALDELVGKDGYVSLISESAEDVKKAFTTVLGEGGRGASAFARRNVTEAYPPDRSARKLRELYRAVSEDDS